MALPHAAYERLKSFSSADDGKEGGLAEIVRALLS